MEEQGDCTSGVCPGARTNGETVSIYVPPTHPLLQLKRALPWEALFEVMTRHWRRAGTNTDGRPGLAWDVTLYVPLVVLMLVKNLNAREMEAYVAENVVARVFMGRQDDPSPQIRDHSNIARAYAALGKDGGDEVNGLMLHVAQDCGFADTSILSADTTAQELPIGYPNEPGILRGWAQRCGRALTKLKTRAVVGVDTALAQVQTILRTVKEHHLFAKGPQEKRQVLTRLLPEVGQVVVQTRRLVQGLGERRDRVTHHAITTLKTMHEVAKRLIPQIVPWITTGVVAKGKIIHAGVTQARAIVRNKAGKKVEFGLPYLLSRLGGGYIFGTMIRGVVDESKMPLQALAGYRAIFGAQATPALVVYDRGGYATTTLRALTNEGVKQIGIQPKGQGAWHVAEAVRKTVRSERGKTEGIIGTLKTDKYGFNKPKERLWQTLEMAGPRSILSYNLNKFMRDLIRADR
ncbi:MAG TPA: hypothetical protein VLQ80_07215 [Candidatus Saccharimonadia bacterium]|nr:hypothetical protein [Candidatus Saccharimonadia bacterium]